MRCIRSGPAAAALDGLKLVAGTRFFWYALPVMLFMPFSSTALIFHVHAIASARNWSSEIVALGFTCYAVGHAAGLLASGALIDRVGARRMLSVMILPLVGLVSLGLNGSEAALLLFFGLMGVSSGLSQTTLAAVWAEIYGVTQLGTIRSFAVMLMVAGTALGPAAIGVLIDAGMPIGTLCGWFVAAGSAAAALAAFDARRAARYGSLTP